MIEFSLFDAETTRPAAAMYMPCVYTPEGCNSWSWLGGGF
jgi:hypothetical protein